MPSCCGRARQGLEAKLHRRAQLGGWRYVCWLSQGLMGAMASTRIGRHSDTLDLCGLARPAAQLRALARQLAGRGVREQDCT